eukprot:scaffold3886_cov399-Prasinococcus_capsulatus_cf.AAC.26
MARVGWRRVVVGSHNLATAAAASDIIIIIILLLILIVIASRLLLPLTGRPQVVLAICRQQQQRRRRPCNGLPRTNGGAGQRGRACGRWRARRRELMELGATACTPGVFAAANQRRRQCNITDRPRAPCGWRPRGGGSSTILTRHMPCSRCGVDRALARGRWRGAAAPAPLARAYK